MNLLFTKSPLFPDERFVPLGKAAKNATLLEAASAVAEKISHSVKAEVEGIWGTLGWADDKPFTPTGQLYFSEEGNIDEGMNQFDEAHELTQQEIANIKEINPDLDVHAKGQVRERYINFNEIDFELPAVFNPLELPKLRLTLFLRPHEGAIVYYQHSERGNKNDPNAVFEYILNQGGSPDRDRLSYLFPVEPKHKLVPVDESKNLYKESDEETGTAFIIKILTFTQKPASEQEIYESQVKELNKSLAKKAQDFLEPGKGLYELVGKDKYDLLLFDAASTASSGGAFVSVTAGDQIKQDAKTLLLIHGTFVNTNSSYKDLLLYNTAKGTSFLQELLQQGHFEQIIALNHPTISHDAEQNVEWFRSRLSALNIRFEQPLQIITTSRGALVAEFMAADQNMLPFIPEISKVMMFSAGNGCGYFQIGGRISAILSIWRKTASGPVGKIILAIAQLSVDWFLSQPGCVLMNPDKPVLGTILNSSPINRNIQYMTVASDWHNCLNEDLEWYKRLGNTSLDTLIKIALGKQHDWVIGYECQKLIPVDSNVPLLEERHSVHGRYLELNYVKHKVDGDCVLMADPHVVIPTFFN